MDLLIRARRQLLLMLERSQGGLVGVSAYIPTFGCIRGSEQEGPGALRKNIFKSVLLADR